MVPKNEYDLLIHETEWRKMTPNPKTWNGGK